MTVLFEPASAIAAGICLTARTIAGGRTARHPRPCGWCDYPLDDLGRMIAGFEAWAEHDERTNTYGRFEVSVFQGLPQRIQDEQVLAAQAFPDAITAPVVAPVHDVDEEGPAWLR